MLIYAAISGHGYGHGSRSGAILLALAQRQPGWRLVLSTSLPAVFLRTVFGVVPFELRPCSWDVGVVQADALGADPAATLWPSMIWSGACPIRSPKRRAG